MTRSLHHHGSPFGLALALAFGALVLPLGVRAQNASPFNAGGNSGNNSLGSSTTSIGTPNFSFGLVPLVQNVTLQPDGSLTTSAEKLDELEDAIRSSVSQPNTQILAPVVEFSRVATEPDVAALTLAQALPASIDSAQLLSRTANLSNQLVASGVEPPKANQLVSLLVSLSQQPNLNQLSAAINLFNQVIRESSPEVLKSLRSNPAFVAISVTLRSARTVLGS